MKFLSFTAIIISLIIANNATAACVGPDYTSISNAVSKAAADATIDVCAGTGSWSNSIVLTMGIKLRGAGIDKTVINLSGRAIDINPSSTAIANNETIEVSGFTFNGGTIGATNPSTSSKFNNLVVGNNKINKASGTAIAIKGQFRGVIFNNTFDGCNVVMTPMGNDSQSEWENFKQAYGSADNLYFEDNTILYSSSSSASDPGWIESGHAGRIVVRYNTWNMANANESEFWDIHGSQYHPNGQYGTMIVEYYGNTLITKSPYRWTHHRGGWGLFFNNVATGSGYMRNDVAAYEGGCDSNVPGEFSTVVSNSYYFNNVFNGSNVPFVKSQDYCGISENINFFNYNASCTEQNCQSGVGIGKPVPSGTCANGAGFWKISNINATVDYTVIQTGTLYKCNQNEWTAYYTPFTYPHPLRSGNPTKNDILEPTGLKVIPSNP